MKPETLETLVMAAAIVALVAWLCAWPLMGALRVKHLAEQLESIQMEDAQ